MGLLPDINVLIALIDPMHVQHDQAHEWFGTRGKTTWATCPFTENGVLRIVGHPQYPNSPGTPAAVVPLLQGLCALSGHEFWADQISLLDSGHVDRARLLASGQISDSYLLALATAHGGQLVTLDQHLVTQAVHRGMHHLLKI